MQITYNNYTPKNLEKSNVAIQISNNLTCLERKYFNNIIYNLHRQASNTSHEYLHIPIVEFTRLSEANITHKRVQATLNKLLTKVIYWIKPTEEKFHNSTYIAEHQLENGMLKIYLAPMVRKVLSMEFCKKSGYTKLNLNMLNELKSTHSMALYEVLCSKTFAANDVTFELNAIQEMLTATRERQGFKSSYYSDYARLNAQVIKKAVADINEKTDITVSYEGIKNQSGKVVKVAFIVERKEKKQAIKPQDKTKEEPIEIAQPAAIKELVLAAVKPKLAHQTSTINHKQGNRLEDDKTAMIHRIESCLKEAALGEHAQKILALPPEDHQKNVDELVDMGAILNSVKSHITQNNAHLFGILLRYVHKKYPNIDNNQKVKAFVHLLKNNIDPHAKSPEQLKKEEASRAYDQRIKAEKEADERKRKEEFEKSEINIQEDIKKVSMYLRDLPKAEQQPLAARYNLYSSKLWSNKPPEIIKSYLVDPDTIDFSQDDLNINYGNPKILKRCFCLFVKRVIFNDGDIIIDQKISA